jgi:hypothetical protein
MKSRTTESFRKAFSELPEHVQRQAANAYRLFKQNPDHPSLRLKRVHSVEPIYSVRISIHYRALGVYAEDALVWFWIGSHADYDRLLSQL